MIMIFGIPGPLLFGQLLLGLINGAFYAMLSLGLAIIFGMLNIINFAHGALFMMGAFAAWMLLQYAGIGYFPSLILAPLIIGVFGVMLERTIISRLYHLDHLYGLLLTFGLALVIQGLFRNYYGSSGLPYRIPDILQGATDLGFMFLPNYRGWVVLAALVVCLATWADHREDPARRHAARGHRERAAGAGVRRQRAAGDHADLWRRRRARRVRRRAGRADLLGEPQHGRQLHQHRVRRGGDRRHGLDHGLHHHRLRARRDRGADQGVLSAGLGHRGVPGDGDRAADPAAWPVRKARLNVRFFPLAADRLPGHAGADRHLPVRAVSRCS